MDSLNFNSVETLPGYKPKEASLSFVHTHYFAYPKQITSPFMRNNSI